MGLDAIFYLKITSHHDVSKKSFFEYKKNGVRFSIMDPLAKPGKQKKTSSYWKFIEVTHSQKSGHVRRNGELIILLKLFFFASRRRKLSLDGTTDFLATIWHHTTSQFFVSFHFGFG